MKEVDIAQASISDAEAIAMINYEMGFKYPANRVAAVGIIADQCERRCLWRVWMAIPLAISEAKGDFI